MPQARLRLVLAFNIPHAPAMAGFGCVSRLIHVAWGPRWMAVGGGGETKDD